MAPNILSTLNTSSFRPRVLVFGPIQPPDVACGVSSAIRAFSESNARNSFDIVLHSTYRTPRDRTIVERLVYGVWLLLKTLVQMIRSNAVLADIHAVSDRSLLSHAAVMFGARVAGRPALLRIHGGDFDRVFEQAGTVQKRLIRLILRSASRVIVLSEGWRSRISAIESTARVEVIPNPVDCDAYGKLSLRPPRKCRRVLFLANLCKRKGHFDAIQAMAQLTVEFPDIVLALGGEDRDPGARNLLEREARRLNIEDRIEFLGTVSGVAKEREIRDADMLILPSHTENMPISLIEGMAAALPVIGTNVGAIPEMIRDGETGFVVKVQDTDALAARIADLCRDPCLGNRLGKAAQIYARSTWDADVVAEQTMRLYRKLATGEGVQ